MTTMADTGSVSRPVIPALLTAADLAPVSARLAVGRDTGLAAARVPIRRSFGVLRRSSTTAR
ncbi:hypothetical protein [Microbacterium sp.]|uniref:hypothetical protein n=1 Tax=Microbacterium sp. TaxID=51671 RepID=UPI002FE3D181